jgi:hypothetical protein
LDACFGSIARSRFDFETVFALVKLETERFVNVDLCLIERGKRFWWRRFWLEEGDNLNIFTARGSGGKFVGKEFFKNGS